MDVACLETNDEFDQKERRTGLDREEVGVGNRCSNIQPTSEPAMEKYLIGKRLEICHQYFLNDGGTELCWSKG